MRLWLPRDGGGFDYLVSTGVITIFLIEAREMRGYLRYDPEHPWGPILVPSRSPPHSCVHLGSPASSSKPRC